jgi:hypothetical protein
MIGSQKARMSPSNCILAVLDQVVIVQAGLHHLARQLVHVDVALVEDDNASGRVVHQKPLGHVVQRRVELEPLGLQFLLHLAVLGVHLPDDQEEDAGDHGGRQCRSHEQETGLFAPVRKRGGLGRGRDHHDREMAQSAAGAEPGLAVDRAFHLQRLFATNRQYPL